MNSIPSHTDEDNKEKKYMTSYREVGLESKKQWLFPNWIVTILKWLSPLLLLALVVPICMTISKLKRAYFLPKLLAIGILAVFLADLISALVHITFVDNAYSTTKFSVDEEGYLIVPVLYGYSSCHHYFPSNWKDIDDSTSWVTLTLIVLIFVFFVILLIKNVVLRLILLLTYSIIPLITISHKYMHELNHGRQVPVWVQCLQSVGFFMSINAHRIHHENHIYDWGLLNGFSDYFVNSIVKGICHWKNTCPIELMTENYELYERKYQTDVVKMRFVGDIEGRIICKRDGHHLLLLKENH